MEQAAADEVRKQTQRLVEVLQQIGTDTIGFMKLALALAWVALVADVVTWTLSTLDGLLQTSHKDLLRLAAQYLARQRLTTAKNRTGSP